MKREDVKYIINNLTKKSVYFDLPFILNVKDNIDDNELRQWLNAKNNNSHEVPHSKYAPKTNEEKLIIGSNTSVFLPERLFPCYSFEQKNIKTTIQLLRRINPNNQVSLCGEVVGDRSGKASFSSVFITFDLENIDTDKYWNSSYFINLAIEAINRFIELYRVYADRHYVRQVTTSTIQNFMISNYIRGKRTTFNQEYIINEQSLDTINKNDIEIPLISMPITLNGLGLNIDDEVDKKIRQDLSKNEAPPILEVLDLEVKDKLDLREWRLASIESAILFESYLNIKIREKLKRDGLEETDIEAKFCKKDKNKTPYSSYEIASKILHSVTNFKFHDTNEFKNWCKNTKDLRNSIVHGKKFIVTKEQAHLSYKSTSEAINLLENYL